MSLLVNFQSLYKETFDCKFYELIGSLKCESDLNFEANYLKNLNLLRESLKIEKKVPDLEWLKKTFKEIFLSK